MRKTLLALIFAGAVVAIAPAPSSAMTGAVPVAKPVAAGSALLRVDWDMRRHH
jgi:hypothetical protein